VAWALGLGEDSPLIPVTDVLLTAPQRGLDPGTRWVICSAFRRSPIRSGLGIVTGTAGPGRR
jgi:hypothetical protein